MSNPLWYERCWECKTILTEGEIANWVKSSEYCCDGDMCNCHGLPLDPPICDRCLEVVEFENND